MHKITQCEKRWAGPLGLHLSILPISLYRVDQLGFRDIRSPGDRGGEGGISGSSLSGEICSGTHHTSKRRTTSSTARDNFFPEVEADALLFFPFAFFLALGWMQGYTSFGWPSYVQSRQLGLPAVGLGVPLERCFAVVEQSRWRWGSRALVRDRIYIPCATRDAVHWMVPVFMLGFFTVPVRQTYFASRAAFSCPSGLVPGHVPFCGEVGGDSSLTDTSAWRVKYLTSFSDLYMLLGAEPKSDRCTCT